MNPEESNVKDIEHVKDKVKIIFASIAVAILVLVELYLMINSPQNYIAIALFGILILGDLYFLISSLIEISYRRDLNRREQYDGIYKAEKASYMVFRKYFDSLAQTLASMDDKLEMPAEEIISAQKAVAKVTINRSKENTDALMNSNDKLIEKLFEFQDLLSENNEKLIEKTAEVNSQSNKENEMRQAELTSKMREMELSIKNEIYQTINQMALSGQFSSAGAVVNPAPAAPISATADEQLAAMISEEIADGASLDMPEITLDFDEPVAEEAVSEEMTAFDEAASLDDIPAMDDIASLDDIPSVDDIAIAEEVANDEEIPAMEDLPSFDELPIDELGVPEDLIAEEPVAEEPIVEPEPAIEEMVEAPVEEAPPMPDLSDPNKMMSPDDIAALLANMGGDSAPAEEPAAEAVAEIEPEPIVEEVVEEPAVEAPPMPDLSDPNKMMSPDDIAALLANMGGDSAPADEEPAPAPEPEPEPEKPPMPDLSDPNKTLSPDEIEALFANL